jgi:hypothetical protein
MNLRSTFARPSRSVVAGLFLVALGSIVVGWVGGTAAAANGGPEATPPAVPGNVLAAQLGAPDAGGASTSTVMAPSIAYPIPAYGVPGIAPEGTILAQGTATSAMKVDGSDRAGALKTATAAALADARTRALAVAASMGVGLKDIYSVSIASSDSYTYPTPECPIAPLYPSRDPGGATGSAGGPPAIAPPVCLQTGGSGTSPSAAQLVVTLLVAYRFG